MKGTYHPMATLCSQVSCINSVCSVNTQDRMASSPWTKGIHLTRLLLSLFVHAGLIQLMISLLVQYVYMRRLEHLLSMNKLSLLYIFSGVFGNLTSSIFLPLVLDTGPNASLFGLLSFWFFEILFHLEWYSKPYWVLFKVILLLTGCFVIGMLPWIDNIANIFGFLYGLLLLCSLRPLPKKFSFLRPVTWILILLLVVVSSYLFYDGSLLEDNSFVQSITEKINCIPQIADLGMLCTGYRIPYQNVPVLN